jgi:Trk K+ transport system NAD-binding subunit
VDTTQSGPRLLSVPDIADVLGVSVTRVHQLLRDRVIIAIRRDGVLRIPAEFVADGEVVRGLAGTITLLTDAGFADHEILDWLFESDAGSSAMAELLDGRVKSVHRRAQVSGF